MIEEEEEYTLDSDAMQMAERGGKKEDFDGVFLISFLSGGIYILTVDMGGIFLGENPGT